MQPNPNAFPTKDVEFTLVGNTSDPNYKPFNIARPLLINYEQIKSKVDLSNLDPNFEVFSKPENITDKFASGSLPMMTLRWKNKRSAKEVNGYAALFYLKMVLCSCMMSSISA